MFTQWWTLLWRYTWTFFSFNVLENIEDETNLRNLMPFGITVVASCRTCSWIIYEILIAEGGKNKRALIYLWAQSFLHMFVSQEQCMKNDIIKSNQIRELREMKKTEEFACFVQCVFTVLTNDEAQTNRPWNRKFFFMSWHVVGCFCSCSYMLCLFLMACLEAWWY